MSYVLAELNDEQDQPNDSQRLSHYEERVRKSLRDWQQWIEKVVEGSSLSPITRV